MDCLNCKNSDAIEKYIQMNISSFGNQKFVSKKWLLQKLKNCKAVPNIPLDNEFNRGYYACCEYINFKIDNLLKKIGEGYEKSK